ncbi:MAG: hypothetical protein VX801_01330 [Gemmatimonadota bacterium]|nr:hypothetical protein [Gemmatimonadota bacterium]
MTRNAVLTFSIAFIGLPISVSAQGGPGFLFERPDVSIALKSGYSLPTAESDLFASSTEHFTLNRSDFGSPYLGGEFAVRATSRMDVGLNVGWARSRSLSEYRDYHEEIGPSEFVPIEQETTFETVTGALNMKYYLMERGRSIGRFAWVPGGVAPYIGSGVGRVGYKFLQAGDFVDVETCAADSCQIFTDHLETDGNAWLVHASLGADFPIGSRGFLTTEARYTYSRGAVRGAFSGYEAIDLSGLQLLAGIGIRL